jgi:hypothetical protein
MNMPTIEEQRDEARSWADKFRAAGYDIQFMYTGDDNGPFDREWQVWTAGGEGHRVGTIYYAGTGAQWAGEDDLYLKVVGVN